MPVPDEFVRAYDYERCEICDRTVPDTSFVHVIVDNDKPGAENEKRWYSVCKDCRERARVDRTFDRYLTEKVFALNLGRKVRCVRNEEKND